MITDSTTIYIAVYSAIVSTAVAAWQVYVRFTEGPRLRAAVGGNMLLAGGGRIDPQKYIAINVANIGNRPTTIQTVGIYTYADRWRRWRRKHDSIAHIVNLTGHVGNAVPHLLEPGRTFTGLGNQTDDMVKLSREKLTYVTISHSMSRKDLLVRLQPIADAKEID